MPPFLSGWLPHHSQRHHCRPACPGGGTCVRPLVKRLGWTYEVGCREGLRQSAQAPAFLRTTLRRDPQCLHLPQDQPHVSTGLTCSLTSHYPSPSPLSLPGSLEWALPLTLRPQHHHCNPDNSTVTPPPNTDQAGGRVSGQRSACHASSFVASPQLPGSR